MQGKYHKKMNTNLLFLVLNHELSFASLVCLVSLEQNYFQENSGKDNFSFAEMKNWC